MKITMVIHVTILIIIIKYESEDLLFVLNREPFVFIHTAIVWFASENFST